MLRSHLTEEFQRMIKIKNCENSSEQDKSILLHTKRANKCAFKKYSAKQDCCENFTKKVSVATTVYTYVYIHICVLQLPQKKH